MDKNRKPKRVVRDGPRVTVEWEDGEPTIRALPSADDAIRYAATRAAELGTYVHDTARQEALGYL